MNASPSIGDLAAVVYAKHRDLDAMKSGLFHAQAEERHAIAQLIDAAIGPVYDGMRSAIRALDAIEEITKRSMARAPGATGGES